MSNELHLDFRFGGGDIPLFPRINILYRPDLSSPIRGFNGTEEVVATGVASDMIVLLNWLRFIVFTILCFTLTLPSHLPDAPRVIVSRKPRFWPCWLDNPYKSEKYVVTSDYSLYMMGRLGLCSAVRTPWAFHFPSFRRI